MELFYSEDIWEGGLALGSEESAHCVRVLRHRAGDEISVIDGKGTLLHCRLTLADAKKAEAEILSEERGFGAHPYRLTMAVCPTKNNDRFEWFIEKATEMGFDRLVPIIGEHSERKVLRTERLKRVMLSAAKQSLKAALPVISEPENFRDYIASSAGLPGLKLICCCFEPSVPRLPVARAMETVASDVSVLIGPEGDFSPEEVEQAIAAGWIPVHLGSSRLRTETAAMLAVAAVYLHNSGRATAYGA